MPDCTYVSATLRNRLEMKRSFPTKSREQIKRLNQVVQPNRFISKWKYKHILIIYLRDIR